MSMSDDTNGRSADEIARDVETSRARVTETLDELKARMSPGQLLDEMLAYTKDAGGDFLTSAGRAVRDNPLPVLLVGAGLALLATSRGGGRETSRYSGSSRGYRERGYMYADDGDTFSYGRGSEGRGMMDEAADSASSMAASVRDTASAGLDTAKDSLSRVGEAVSGAASSASEMAGSLYRRTTGAAGSVGETLSHSTDYARRMLHDRRDDVASLSSSARRRAQEVFDDQPLVVAALGLAIGAVLGAALPRSRAEDELMGEAAERAREAAREVAEAGYRQARDVVEDTMRHVTEELSERGLSTDAVREAAEAAAEKARQAAMRAVDQGSRQGQRPGQGFGQGQRFGEGRATGGEGYVPPRQDRPQEGLGGLHRTPGDTAPGAPSTRTGPVI